MNNLIEAMKYWNSDDFRKLQTRLTKTSNSITNDALQHYITPFLSPEEIATLKRSASILKNIKGKVEHAKEVKNREERAKEKQLSNYREARKRLISQHLPLSVKHENYVEIVTWRLLLTWHLKFNLNRSCVFVSDNKHLRSELERATSSTHHRTFEGLIRSCRNDVYEAIEDYLWPYDQQPDEDQLIQLINGFKFGGESILKKEDQLILNIVKEEVLRMNFIETCETIASKRMVKG